MFKEPKIYFVNDVIFLETEIYSVNEMTPLRKQKIYFGNDMISLGTKLYTS